MAENEGIVEQWDQMGPAGTFSQLLFSPDRVVGLDLDHSTSFTYSASSKPPKMLCFGNHGDAKAEEKELHLVFPAAQSEPTRTTNNTLPKNHKKRNVTVQEPPQLGQCNAAVTSELPAAAQRNCKKNKSDNSTPTKARKEKLGERIAALQQLVSPFGKTDTASVLHEAMGYIRFLHDQVQVLCSPYLLQQRLPSSANNHHQPEGEGSDLSSRGLCLVPVELTVHMDNSNGADFWSPAMGNTFSSSSTATKL